MPPQARLKYACTLQNYINNVTLNIVSASVYTRAGTEMMVKLYCTILYHER